MVLAGYIVVKGLNLCAYNVTRKYWTTKNFEFAAVEYSCLFMWIVYGLATYYAKKRNR